MGTPTTSRRFERPMTDRDATLGLILDGGLGRRLGGVDKGLVLIAGRPMIARAIERLRPQCAGLAISANGDPARFAGLRLPVLADEPPEFAGPLAGVLAGLEYAARLAPGITHVATLPADAPFAPQDFVERLHEGRRASGGRSPSPRRAVGPITLRRSGRSRSRPTCAARWLRTGYARSRISKRVFPSRWPNGLASPSTPSSTSIRPRTWRGPRRCSGQSGSRARLEWGLDIRNSHRSALARGRRRYPCFRRSREFEFPALAKDSLFGRLGNYRGNH